MKNLTFAAATLALLLCFTSCSEKEGVYNPKKKIDKVYESVTNTTDYYDSDSHSWGNSHTETIDKYLSQRWTWDGKTVTKIEHLGPDGTVYSTSFFKYDDNRLVRIEDGDEYAIITYNDKQLKTIEIHSPMVIDEEKSVDEEVSVYTMYYDGDKITKINLSGSGSTLFKKSQIKSTLCSTLLPKQIDNIVEKTNSIISKKAGKGAKGETQESIDINLTWTGDNVTMMTTNMVLMGFFNIDLSVTYTFDKKNNPFRHFVNTSIDGMTFLNENNVLTETMVTKYINFITLEPEEDTEVTTYSYEYDGKWPKTITSEAENITYQENDEGEEIPTERVKEVYKTYYEYK